jgi:hypothetical protein
LVESEFSHMRLDKSPRALLLLTFPVNGSLKFNSSFMFAKLFRDLGLYVFLCERSAELICVEIHNPMNFIDEIFSDNAHFYALVMILNPEMSL